MKEYRLLSTNPRSYTGKYDRPSNMLQYRTEAEGRGPILAYWMGGRIFQYRTEGLCHNNLYSFINTILST